MKKLDFEYGHGLMSANLPDNTDVFIPGETVKDPECLPQDWDSLYEATLESIRNPMGMPPLRELAAPGKTVVFVIPDIVKGGTQPTSHRKVSIKACLDELYAGGVEKKDILLLISNGLHPRATVAEMKQILGEELFNEFYYSGQLTSHDSEDYEHMVDLGFTKRGDPVLMNKYVYECDIPILIGHTQGNPYGGYSGGYKHCATGITHWRSIASHHVPSVMHGADFTPVSGHSLMRTKEVHSIQYSYSAGLKRENLGCQGVYREDVSKGGNFGAFTSCRSAKSMAALGCGYTIIGHCEERRNLKQIISLGGGSKLDAVNSILNAEILRAQEAGMKVLYCIGEDIDEVPIREKVLRTQLEMGLAGCDLSNVVIGYEPLWAIGPGRPVPTADVIEAVASLCKSIVDCPVVYGGGLKKDNAAMIASVKSIDGGLIALTRFSGDIGFYPEEYIEITEKYLAEKNKQA